MQRTFEVSFHKDSVQRDSPEYPSHSDIEGFLKEFLSDFVYSKVVSWDFSYGIWERDRWITVELKIKD